MSNKSKRWRDAAAKSLWTVRSLPKGSYRDIVASTADLYKSLAHAEEQRSGERERSKERRPPQLGNELKAGVSKTEVANTSETVFSSITRANPNPLCEERGNSMCGGGGAIGRNG